MANSEYVLENEKDIMAPWSNLLEMINFLQKKGMMAEFTTRLEIKPMSIERKEQVGSNESRKRLVQNILRKHSHGISLELRKDFSLGEITDEKIDLSLLDGMLAEYADGEEDSVELVKSTRRRF